MMKDHWRMVFRSGMSEASASINTSRCMCDRSTSPTPWLEFHSSRTSSLSVKSKKQKTETTALANLPSLALIIVIPSLPLHSVHASLSSFIPLLSLYFPSELLCLPRCIPWPLSDTSSLFLRARISPVQCPISENETRESGYRNAPFPPDSLSITVMESYDDIFYCICRISELTLEITHCTYTWSSV